MRPANYFILLLLLCFFFLPSATEAKSIFDHQNSNVPSDQTVDDVVVVGGDADIAGTVNSSVIVVNGNAHIRSSAHINGLVFIVGGKLQQDPGAKLAKDVVNISFDDATRNGFLIGGGLVLGLWVCQLAGSVLMVLVPTLLIVFGKRRMLSLISQYGSQSPGKLVYTGFFTGLLFVAACLLLILTLIGIPLILIIGLIVLASVIIGITILGSLVGDQIRGIAGKPEWIRAVTGSSILAALINIPFVGPFILLILIMYSLGVMTTWAVEWMRNKKRRQ